MKKDKNGCSTIVLCSENYKSFYSDVLRKKLIQYDFRTESGKLFSCVGKTIEACRAKRDAWLASAA